MMRWLTLVLLLASGVGLAQTTEAELRTRLVDRPLYLRGQWADDTLRFDGAGRVVKSSGVVPFTLSGIRVDAVTLKRDKLVLEGTRVGLEFAQDVPKRVELKVLPEGGQAVPEQMRIEIKAPIGGDYAAALDVIFTEDLASVVPSLPEYWQVYGREHFLPAAASGGGAQVKAPVSPTVSRIGGSVRAPVPTHMVDPEFNGAARALRYSGRVLVYLQVDESGKPNHIRVLRPIGLGLDERAVVAASQYTFVPAKRAGVPVAVEMNMEVNFQIY